MTIINNEDWLNVLENTDYEPIENENNTYQSYRFVDLDIESVTTENYVEKLMPSLVEQIEMFIPPSGSFRSCSILLSHPYLKTSLFLGSSTSEFF
mgnify:CR=1 FL=1